MHATEWTVMVYMNADNNLECFGMQDLKEMVQALTGTSASNMPNVVVLSDRGPEQCGNNWIPGTMLSEIPSGVRLSVTCAPRRMQFSGLPSLLTRYQAGHGDM